MNKDSLRKQLVIIMDWSFIKRNVKNYEVWKTKWYNSFWIQRQDTGVTFRAQYPRTPAEFQCRVLVRANRCLSWSMDIFRFKQREDSSLLCLSALSEITMDQSISKTPATRPSLLNLLIPILISSRNIIMFFISFNLSSSHNTSHWSRLTILYSVAIWWLLISFLGLLLLLEVSHLKLITLVNCKMWPPKCVYNKWRKISVYLRCGAGFDKLKYSLLMRK